MGGVIKSRFHDSLRVKLLIGIVTVLLIALMFPSSESLEFEAIEGSVWIHEDLIAPFSFPILKSPEIYRKEVTSAVNRVYPIFISDNSKANQTIDSFKVYSKYLFSIFDKLIADSTHAFRNSTFLTDKTFRSLLSLYRQKNNTIILVNAFKKCSELLFNVAKAGIITTPAIDNFRDSIALRIGNIDNIVPYDKYLTVENAKTLISNKIKKEGYTSDLEASLAEFTLHFVAPSIIYMHDLTDAELAQAQNLVSKYSGIVNENEKIVEKHERITKDTKLKLDSYRTAKVEKFQDELVPLQLLGKFFHIASLITMLSIYFYNFRKKIIENNIRLLIFALMFVFISFVTYLVNHANVPVPLQFIIFVPAASMILTIIFDSRVGFYSTVIISLITGALRGNDYSFAVMNLFAGALGVYTVRDIKNRSQIFRSFFFILVGYSVAVIAFGLERFAPFSTIVTELAFAATNAVISPVLTYGLLIFFEKLFNITTDLTLLELSNFDRPLLRDLARSAPGTFNHSMTMGTIAEAAAEKVGANTLLARVGAYYHDIGKILQPKYFAENQLSEDNIHEEVHPQESVELIKKHVEDGIKLGRQHNLPDEVIDFIPMHHGTLVMKYFYEKAKEQFEDEIIDAEEYKYAGPIPNTKETAIVMLADGCESAARSIEDPDQEKIENVVDNIISDRIENGQLNNSPLTLSDIDKIRDAFKNILIGQHHRRVRYPNQDEIEKGIDEEQDE